MFDFPSPASEGQFYAPSGGPQYVYTNGAWRMLGGQAAWPSDATADMSIGFRTSGNRFVVNDKADLTGTDVMTVTEGGALTATGIVTAGSRVISSGTGGYFIGTATNASLGLTSGGSGTISFRPNGYDSTTGQTTINNAGTITVAGYINAGGNVQAASTGTGYFIGGPSATVLGAPVGSPGTIYLRPTAYNSGTGQTTIDSAGAMTVAGSVIAGGSCIATTGSFMGSATSANLGTNAGAGTIYLRPNGTGSATGQTSISSAGDMDVAGFMRSVGDVITDNVRTNSSTGQLYVAGGTSGQSGAHIELYAQSHASLASRIYYDANVHTFRAQSGTGSTVAIQTGTIEGGSYATGVAGYYLSLVSSAGRLSCSSATATQSLLSLFTNTNGNVGSISTTNSATAFNTSSDERLKTFIGPYDPLKAIDIIRRDPVRDFTWTTDGTYAVGWGAQTSHEVSADLASPPPGDVLTKEPGDEDFTPWGMDQGKRTPYLWAALSWALDKIDQLEARIATLEGA